MELPAEQKAKSEVELEKGFLDALSATPLPLPDLLAVLTHLLTQSREETAAAWADMLQEALAERADRAGSLRLLAFRSPWQSRLPNFRETCLSAAQNVFKDRLGAAYVQSAGFDRDVPVAECVRRLAVLNAIKPQGLCLDRTWGFGVIRHVDDFYQKITIDFKAKPGHQMSFAYAAEALQLLGDDHLLARLHRDPQGTRTLLAEDPAEAVRLALRSYGPLSVPDLKDKLVGDLLDESRWKEFWDAARKALRADPLVVIPSRRSEPVKLLQRERSFDDAWFAELGGERDIETLLRKITELEADGGIGALGEARRDVLRERLNFAIVGAAGLRPDLLAAAAMLAERLSLWTSPEASEKALTGLVEPASFQAATYGLPAREVDRFLRFMRERRQEEVDEVMLSLLPDLKIAVVAECLALLVEGGKEHVCAARLREMVENRTAGPIVLYWVCRNRDIVDRWALVAPPDLLAEVVEVMKEDVGGEQLRAQNQLRKLIEQDGWMDRMMEELSPVQREIFLSKVINGQGIDADLRQTMLARIVLRYPELREIVAAGALRSRGEKTRARYTSWRSYRERQSQLKELIEVKIPANSRDIAHARSYGDLRENFEYQAAKDQQRLLMRRQQELERDLREVKGTDFGGMAIEACGMGTSVTFAHPDGREETLNILGEWDRDESLGVIACASKLAQALEGRKPGQEAVIPTDTGEETCRVVRVELLPSRLRQWAVSHPVETRSPGGA